MTTTWGFDKNLNLDDFRTCIEILKSHNLTVNDLHVSGSDTDHTRAWLSIAAMPNLRNAITKISRITEPKLKPYLQCNIVQPRSTSSFTPLQLAQIYNFPQNLDGTGQTIGVIELGGGYVLSDITTYLKNLGINIVPNIHDVSVDGGTNNPKDQNASVEVVLDIEIIVAIAPKANIRVYFAPNTNQSFYNAISQAITDNCNIISISWGGPESSWDTTSLTSFNNLFQQAANKGINVFVAAGDNGSSDGTNASTADFPASSQYVIACGGTYLVANNNVRSQETVWNDNNGEATGGGISSIFSKPSYQNNITLNLNNHRAIPDIAADADPKSGYVIYYNGSNNVVGGTSAVAPLMSGLLARINQSLKINVGFLNPILYNNPSICYDITQGNDGAWSATTSYDLCTGLGVIDGTKLLNLLASLLTSVAIPLSSFIYSPSSGTLPLIVQFTDTSQNNPTSWSWDFGDGSTSTLQNPSHIFNNVGNYNVTLTARNNLGSNTSSHTISVTATTSVLIPVSSFTYNPSSGTVPLTVQFTDTSQHSPTSWVWNFGDNSTSTSQNPSHVFNIAGTYNVTLTASNTAGSNTTSHSVTVTSSVTSPVAAFTYSPSSGPAPLTVQFTNTTLNTPTSLLWNFGDTQTSTSSSPSHVFNNAGTYNVLLTAANSAGTSSISNTVTVTTVTGLGPVTRFTYLHTQQSLSILFINETINALSYNWDFGDTHTSKTENPIHRYQSDGTYTVILTATNASSSTSVTHTVIIKANHPVANFVTQLVSGTLPFKVHFNNRSINSTSYKWDFGDSITSTQTNPTHTYINPGMYTVKLVATNGNDMDVMTKTNLITVINLKANFEIDAFIITKDTVTNFINKSQGEATDYYWIFGDGNISSAANPNHTYTKPGLYRVQFYAHNNKGDTIISDSKEREIFVI